MDNSHIDGKSNRNKFYYTTGCLFELTKWLAVGIVLLLMINFFVITVFIIDGVSMEPNFHSGEIVIANRFQYLFQKPNRLDPVTIKFPGDPDHKKYIKRVIGLPGETVLIKDNAVYINNKKLDEPYLEPGIITVPDLVRVLGPDDYFLLGDNRENSSDSRIWGVAPRRDLVARAWLVIWPINYLGIVTEYK